MKKLALWIALSITFPAFGAADCVKQQSVCAEPNQTRTVDGVSVFRECWRYTDTYQCRGDAMLNDCQPLRDRGCGQTGSVCVSRDDDGSCRQYEQSFQCPDRPAKTVEKNVCETSFCQADDAGCFDTSRPLDKDFGQAAAIMEAQREAGVYGIDPDKIEIFKGYMEECSQKVIGGSTLKNCCSASSGGQNYTNYAVIGMTAKAAYAAGKEELKAGSKYLYDALFSKQDSELIKEGMSAAGQGLSEAAADGVASQAGSNFGAYGFEFSYSSAGGFEFVSFDPYSFAASVAIMLIQQWLSCDQDEQVMSLKRGQNLCVHIDTYCSSKVFGVCVERKERHCCFNSVLAKLINRQGRAQLGLTEKECGGFNQEQLQALDFSKIDLSEFIATIVPRDVNSGELQGDVANTVDRKVRDYYGDSQ